MKKWVQLVCVFLCVLLVGGCAAPSPGGESSPESVPLTDSDGESSPESAPLTVSDAETVVKNNLPPEDYELYVEFQSKQTINDRLYYYFLVYSLGSEPLMGDQGSYYQQFTYAWAYVDALTGELYEMLVSGKGLRPWLGQSPDSLDLDYKIKSDTDVVLANNTYAQKWYGLSAYYLGRLIEADFVSALHDPIKVKTAVSDIHSEWEAYAKERIKNEETLLQWKYEKSSAVEETVSKYTYDLYRAHALEMYFFCSNVEMEGLGTAADVEDNTLWTFVAEIDEQEATVQQHVSLEAEYTQAFKECNSNADKAQTKEQYAEKWYDLAEQYVNQILQGDFDSRIKETVKAIHKEWKTYVDKRVDYELVRLQSIHGSASTVSGAITGFEYDLYRAHTLEMSRLCRMLMVDSNE